MSHSAASINRVLDYALQREPKDRTYHQLIDFVVAAGATGLLVVRRHPQPGPSCERFVEGLASCIVSSSEQAEWPGTRLLDDVATVYRISLDYGSGELLKYAVDGLYEWQHPNLPEDFGALRADGSTLLGSIAHERNAWLSLNDLEFEKLRHGWPALVDLLER